MSNVKILTFNNRFAEIFFELRGKCVMRLFINIFLNELMKNNRFIKTGINKH